jgi:hypothetical protein
MTTAFTAFSFTATGGSTSRTLPSRISDIVNVKDYGAKGDGVTDDIKAIQAAFDAAFGPASNANGGYSSAFMGHAGYPANKSVFFPSGTYNISASIKITQVFGAYITGAGKRATRIVNTLSGGAISAGDVFHTDGFTFSCIENMTMVSPTWGGSINHCFDLAYSGTILNQVNTHGILFRNVRFEGGNYGCGLGDGGMGSEVIWLGCDFVSCVTGIESFNQNALDFNILGCRFQSCGTGINMNSENYYIAGCTFTGSTSQDVSAPGGSPYVIEGCGSTSTTIFMNNIGAIGVNAKCCYYHPASLGNFSVCQAALMMDGNVATNCLLQGAAVALGGGTAYVRGNVLPGNFFSGSTLPPTILEGPY